MNQQNRKINLPKTDAHPFRISSLPWGMVLNVALAVLATGSCGFAIHTASKLSTIVTLEESVPAPPMRLQVTNVSGMPGISKPLSRRIASDTTGDFPVTVVDRVELPDRKIAETFLIIRDNRIDADALARRFSLSHTQVFYRPMEQNDRQVAATLVLGVDWPDKVSHMDGSEL